MIKRTLIRSVVAIGLVTACSTGSPSAVPTTTSDPVATASPTPTTSPTPTATSTLRALDPRPHLPPLVDGEADACLPGCASGIVEPTGPLRAGLYQTQWFFGGALTMEVGEGMNLREDSTGEFGVVPASDPLGYGLVFWLDPYVIERGTQIDASYTREAFLDALAEHPDLVVSSPQDGAIGSIPAHVVDVHLAEDAQSTDPTCPVAVCVEFISYPEFTHAFGIGDDDEYRFYVADVRYSGTDHLFVAAVEGMDFDHLDTFAESLAPMISTVQIPAKAASAIAPETGGPSSPQVIGSITARDEDTCELEVDASVTPGPFRIETRNELPEPYAVAFDMFRLADDVSFDELVNDMQRIRDRLESGEPYEAVAAEGYPEYLSVVDQVELPDRESSGELAGTLESGRYIIECTVPLHVHGEFWPIVEAGPIEVD